MLGRVFAAILLVSLLTVCGVVAQSPSGTEKSVWTMEFIKVKPGMFGLTLGYLDDNWMRVCEEAKHKGAILNYYRIAEHGSKENDGNVVLLTECGFRKFWHVNSGNSGTVCTCWQDLFQVEMTRSPRGSVEMNEASSF